MAAELASAEYAFLIILRAEGREISNTEMDKLYEVRLRTPIYEKLNALGYVSSDTSHRPYRHAITNQGLKVLAGPLTIEAEDGEKRTLREKQLWAAVVAQHNGTRPDAGIEDGIRAAYRELAAGPGEWVDLAALRQLLGDVSKTAVDRALIHLLDEPDVRLEPEPFGHRIGPEERRAAVHIGGEDRHKLAIGLR
ncbi:hypothetical protein [Paractinoplanes durhamensis]|uniref:Uncharacterized protein n=1 Tax=Paractinoplanes durhamensis TaxID=113563 RepID=A0ABQ3ZB53_9ACTN|nr:hypothetical protein [Actinoplanes durhamensis]GIE07042.1 hypothetical protein Adu01nite_83920 [Actinoplanes durhamensis]